MGEEGGDKEKGEEGGEGREGSGGGWGGAKLKTQAETRVLAPLSSSPHPSPNTHTQEVISISLSHLLPGF